MAGEFNPIAREMFNIRQSLTPDGWSQDNAGKVLTAAPDRLWVARAEMGADWPLNVVEAYVGCDGNTLWMARGRAEKLWALNGSALQNGMPDVSESGM